MWLFGRAVPGLASAMQTMYATPASATQRSCKPQNVWVLVLALAPPPAVPTVPDRLHRPYSLNRSPQNLPLPSNGRLQALACLACCRPPSFSNFSPIDGVSRRFLTSRCVRSRHRGSLPCQLGCRFRHPGACAPVS
jgi:hypothetical protein